MVAGCSDSTLTAAMSLSSVVTMLSRHGEAMVRCWIVTYMPFYFRLIAATQSPRDALMFNSILNRATAEHCTPIVEDRLTACTGLFRARAHQRLNAVVRAEREAKLSK
jgi:hypothetical protein